MHNLFVLILRFMLFSFLTTAISLLDVDTTEATQTKGSASKYKFGAQFVSLERRFHGMF